MAERPRYRYRKPGPNSGFIVRCQRPSVYDEIATCDKPYFMDYKQRPAARATENRRIFSPRLVDYLAALPGANVKPPLARVLPP